MLIVLSTNQKDYNNKRIPKYLKYYTPLRFYPSGIEAKYQRFYKYGFSRCAPTFALAFFDKQIVSDALGPGRSEVSVVGEFLSGRFFFGSDIIKIATHKHPPNHWHW